MLGFQGEEDYPVGRGGRGGRGRGGNQGGARRGRGQTQNLEVTESAFPTL